MEKPRYVWTREDVVELLTTVKKKSTNQAYIDGLEFGIECLTETYKSP